MEARPDDATAPTPTPAGKRPAAGESADSFPAHLRSALRDREAGALATFYDAYFDRLYGYVRRLVGEQHLAEDLTQEIFMHVIERLGSYDPSRALRPWVFTIATNKVRDHWRSRSHQRNRGEVSLELDETGGWARADTPRPDQELAGAERSARIERAIQELPESMRLTLILRYYKQLSFAEIGEIVERNEAAVRKRYSRALEELRQRLSDLGGEAGA